MADVKKVWSGDNTALYLNFPAVEYENLENVVYKINVDQFGRFFLNKVSDDFSFDYKLYGLESSLVERVLKTYSKTNGNLGILLNGLKGTGKTVTSKIIANRLNQPVIVVSSALKGVEIFLNSISQNITIFIDEYEKVFGDSSAMLTIMDGALNSEFRRVFLLTTNQLHVQSNLIQRPSRIRYLKEFKNLTPELVEEIIDDTLENKDLKKACINFISNLESITVDIVKAVITEVNIHDEAPTIFQSIFNVKKLTGKFNVKLREESGKLSLIAKNVDIYPKPTFDESEVGRGFSIDGDSIGYVSRIVNWTTIEVSPYENGKGKSVGFDEPIILKIEDADVINYSYAYSEYGAEMAKEASMQVSDFAKKIIQSIEEYKTHNEDDEESEDDMMRPKRSLSAYSDSPVKESNYGSLSTSDMSELLDESPMSEG